MGEEGGRGSGMFEKNTKNMVHVFKNVQAGTLNDSLRPLLVSRFMLFAVGHKNCKKQDFALQKSMFK